VSRAASRPASVKEQVALAPHTTLQLGGPARYFIEAHDEGALFEALEWAGAQKIPIAILGGGSNVVAKDDGFDGLVIALRTRGVKNEPVKSASVLRGDGPKVHVTAAAGEVWDELVAQCVSDDLAGIECLSGIPGLVGATPIQNVGAYGQEVSHTIVEVRVLERASMLTRVLSADECAFEYRNSALKRDPSRYVVLEVTFALTQGGLPALRYAELVHALAAQDGTPPSLQQVRDTVIRLRRAKGMVLDAPNASTHASSDNSRSAGSFFLNPIVSVEQADALAARLLAEGRIAKLEAMPRFPASPILGTGHVKLAAAWLIEACGFSKGERRGGVGISTQHSLALTCHSGASTAQLLAFASEIEARVHERFGVRLEREPVLL
jgi:UDP-N-acetylmuramate dehydrogenase